MTTTSAPTADTADDSTTPTTTPPRHNYSDPNTPIASIKRPRSSLTLQQQNASRRSLTPPREDTALSPMHPPRPEDENDSSWVGRKVDALFSPVLSFLNTADTASTTCTDPDDEEDGEDHGDEDSMQALVEDHSLDEDEFNPWQFIKSLPAYDRVQHLRPPVALPPKAPDAPELTLVLDLDETLVHCTIDACEHADLIFPVQFHGIEYQVHVQLRPFLKQFLEKVSGKFEVVVFTASQKVYANELLNLIDPEGKYIHHRLFRESCLAVEGNFLKDLTVLGRDLAKTVLVDNSPHAFGYQVDNGVPIESWFDAKDDRELLKLEKFCRQLLSLNEDVRKVIRNKFGSHERIAKAPDL